MIHSKKIITFLLSFSLFFLLASSVSAQTVSDNHFVSGDNLNITGDYEKDVFIFGNNINFDGTVGGDLYVAAQTMHITGSVKGNLYAASNQAIFDVTVDGSLRGMFTQADINGIVGKNMTIMATDLTSNSQVNWHTAIIGKILRLSGSAQRWYVEGSNITFSGQSSSDIYIKNYEKNGRTQLTSTANITGDVNYIGNVPLDVQTGSTVTGETISQMYHKKNENRSFDFSQLFWWLVNVFGLITVGLVLITLLGKKLLQISDAYETQNFKYLWTGLIAFLLIPILCVVLAFTFIGLPLAIMLILVYIASFYFTQIFVGIWLGGIILKKISSKPKLTSINKNYLFWSLVIGIIVWRLLVQIPFMGGLLTILAFIFTLGIFVSIYKSNIKSV